MNELECIDSLKYLKTFPNYHFNINYSDPPYGLGSEIIIKPNGKPDYNKGIDFMNKWKFPNGEYWENWFKESYRILKYGGYCIMFGMDRQLLIPKYYASLAGFQEKQSLYWYFISNFPKSADLSKNIDKHVGAKREVIGVTNNTYDGVNRTPTKHKSPAETSNVGKWGLNETPHGLPLTLPSTPLAQKYDGYKYSISPLKQTNETIMVFQKPYKSGSCLHDTLIYENGDEECCCGALNIDNCRVPTNENLGRQQNNSPLPVEKGFNNNLMGNKFQEGNDLGRFPSQTFCDSECAKILDEQSGIRTSGAMKSTYNVGKTGKDGYLSHHDIYGKFKAQSYPKEVESSSGGCSKILHKCDFEDNEHNIYFYCPKVSKTERVSGCDENKHPTLKPISLNTQILKLFKTPNPQKIIFPFAGSGSEIIGGIKAGFNDWNGCELSSEYIKIANARIKYWSNKKIENGKIISDNKTKNLIEFI